MIVSLSATDKDINILFLPFSAWAWKQQGFQPLVFMPNKDYGNNYEKSRILRLIYDACDCDYAFFKPFNPGNELNETIIAKYFACAIDMQSEKKIAVSDINIIPLSGIDIPRDFTVYNDYEFSIGTAHQWRDRLGVNGFSPDEYIHANCNVTKVKDWINVKMKSHFTDYKTTHFTHHKYLLGQVDQVIEDLSVFHEVGKIKHLIDYKNTIKQHLK